MKYLVDTNIFLEILLEQENEKKCKDFLTSNIGDIFLSDFSLHSIGVFLFREKREELFKKFLNDSVPNVSLLTLSEERYERVLFIHKNYNLDFDDSFQTAITEEYDLSIATQDRDFNKVKQLIRVKFI